MLCEISQIQTSTTCSLSYTEAKNSQYASEIVLVFKDLVFLIGKANIQEEDRKILHPVTLLNLQLTQ